jgi:hypothetical protein
MPANISERQSTNDSDVLRIMIAQASCSAEVVEAPSVRACDRRSKTIGVNERVGSEEVRMTYVRRYEM